MAILGKIGGALKRIGQYYTSPDGLQTMQAILSDYGNPGGGAFERLQDRRAKAMQQQQQADALNALMAQIQPDTMTPQVNELIGGANQTGQRMGMAPMESQAPRWQPGFDFSSDQGRAALTNYLTAGGKPSDLKALTELGQPENDYQLFQDRTGRVVRVSKSGQRPTEEAFFNPEVAQYFEQQAAQYDPTVFGTPAWSRVQANRRADAPKPGPAPKPTAPAPSAIDAPWLQFRR